MTSTDLHFQKAYFVLGPLPREAQDRYTLPQATKEPPVSGWSYAFVIEAEDAKEKKAHKRRCTMFHPWTLWSMNAPSDCLELKGKGSEVVPLDPERSKGLCEIIRRQWERACRLGTPADFDVAALVLSRLGGEVPKDVPKGDGDQATTSEPSGGKAAGSKLLKAVPAHGKRGKVLEFFLKDAAQQSLREAMAVFGMSRSSVLSALYNLNKDHGIGYVVKGDTAWCVLPRGCDNPFTAEPVKVEKSDIEILSTAPEADDAQDDDDDSWFTGRPAARDDQPEPRGDAGLQRAEREDPVQLRKPRAKGDAKRGAVKRGGPAKRRR